MAIAWAAIGRLGSRGAGALAKYSLLDIGTKHMEEEDARLPEDLTTICVYKWNGSVIRFQETATKIHSCKRTL